MTFDIDANGILDVKAKDRATGKEQQVRITASSMLAKDDVDKMVRDAQEHADEDRQRREEVETRNQAEQLTYQAERTIKDLGDKVSSEDKADGREPGHVAPRGAQGLRSRGDHGRRLGPGRDAQPRLDGRLPGLRPLMAAATERTVPGGEGSGEGSPEGEPAGAATGGAGEETVEGEFKEV